MVRLLLTAIALAGCYHPTLVDCTVVCGPGGSCPSGMTCQDGLCAAPRSELLVCPAGPSRRLSVGLAHACLIKFDGSLWCWGANDHGQLGGAVAITTDSNVPFFAAEEGDWASVSAGATHTCALRMDGTAYCWGDNSVGQLGVGDTMPRISPAPVSADPGWVTISAGSGRTCGSRNDGSIWCWGGASTTPSPVPDATGALVSVGRSEVCTLGSDRRVFCDGQPEGAGNWNDLSVGGAHACAVDGNGALSCWGDNSDGQLGTGDQTPHADPTMVGSGFALISAGAAQSCALATDGHLSCWGKNDDGRLGDGTNSAHATPTLIGGADWFLVRTGGSSTCGVHTDGTVQCWGANDRGQLGDGTNTSHNAPTDVAF